MKREKGYHGVPRFCKMFRFIGFRPTLKPHANTIHNVTRVGLGALCKLDCMLKGFTGIRVTRN